jgi:hypothetical protein
MYLAGIHHCPSFVFAASGDSPLSAKEMGLDPAGNAAGLGERAMGKILTAIPISQNLFSMDLDKRHIH